MFRVVDFERLIEEEAPIFIKEEYDNVGLMIGNRNDIIDNIFISLDVSLDTIAKAKENNCNLIFSHHPLIFKKPSFIVEDDLQGKKIREAIINNINIYSAHTNLDFCNNGLNHIFAEFFPFKSFKMFEDKGLYGIGIIGELDNEYTVEKILTNLKNDFNINNLRCVGDVKKTIKNILLINGSGASYSMKAISEKIDMLITGDVTYHYASDARESNLVLVDAGHFEIENKLFEIYAERLYEKLKENGFNGKIIKDNIITPYNYI